MIARHTRHDRNSVRASLDLPADRPLALVSFGASLALGSLTLLLLACAAPFYFQRLIRREEAFLARHYGDRYAAYCASVPRWLGPTGS